MLLLYYDSFDTDSQTVGPPPPPPPLPTTFDDAEASISQSMPIELYDFQFANGTHIRRTTWSRDFVLSGITWSAGTLRRGSLPVLDSQNTPTFSIDVATTDPLVAMFTGVGVAPQQMKVTIYRWQQIPARYSFLKSGLVADCSLNGRTATFRIAQVTDDSFRLHIPNIVASRTCNHVLYDALCGVQRAANQVNTAISTVGSDFRSISVGSTGSFSAVDDFVLGDCVHGPSGERRTIVAQNGTALTLDIRLPNTARPGDAFTIWRGCLHDINTCQTKHSNVPNFGGMPHLSTTIFFFDNITRIG